MASKKLHLDKYYSPQSLADYCTQKAIEVIGIENITELVESSAGNGVFLNSFEKFLPNIPYQAYDIEPEDDRIVKQDYLKLEMEYKKGLCVLTNPPFGDRNNLYRKFYNKSVEFSDYICFIGGIKLLNNSTQNYKFDLIYSEDLGMMEYSGINLHCCFNIYKRPSGGLNKKTTNKLRDVTLYREDDKEYDSVEYDFSICRMGDIWRPIMKGEPIVRNFKVKVKNKDMVSIIVESIKTKYNSKNKEKSISTPYIVKEDIYKYLKEQIDGIE